MASRTLVSGLPWSLPPLPPGPAPTCVPCVEGRQRAAPHSSEFPPTEAPLKTLHMDVSSPASAPCSCRPLSHETLLWHHRLGHPSLPRLRGMASRTLVSGLPWSLPPLPPGPAPTCVPCVEGRQRAAPHSSEFPPTEAPLKTLHMDVWGPARGSRPLVRDTFVDKLSSRAVPCVFLGLPPDAHGWQFYHPTSRHVLSSQDVTFDESVSYYRLFPYRIAPLPPPPPLFLSPGAPPVDPLPPQGPAPSGVSQVDPFKPVEVAVDSGAARGAEPVGAGPGGAEPGAAESKGAEPGGAEPERLEPGGAEPGGAESGGAEPGGAEPERAESGGPPSVPSRRELLSPQRLREWYARRYSRAAGATGPAAGGASGAGGAAGAGAAGAAGAGGTGAVGGPAGVGVVGGAGAAGPGGARTGGTGAAGAGGAAGVRAVGAGAVATGGAAGAGAARGSGVGGAAGVVAGDPGAEGTGAISAVSGGAARPRPYPPPVQSQSQLPLASPLPCPSPYSGPTRGLTERREPESRPASSESRPASPESHTESPGTQYMTLRPSTAPQRVPLPSPPASSLPGGPDPESDSLRAASPTVTRFLATIVTDPSFESTAASALVVELVEFATACRIDYAASLVAESESASVCPPSVGGECALGTDVLEDRQEEFECFAAALPHLVSMLLAPEEDPDAPDIPTPRSYAEAIEGPYSS
ncbi:unnamed protein product [Closterium sp. NIES-53]